jgi:predicted XRE-type DNA-binding protein
MAKRAKVTYASASAFHALGLPDADELVVRADLMRRLSQLIVVRRLTQAQAGKLMGMDQPRVSALLHGRIGKFSTERLLKALSALGQDVELRIVPSKTRKGKLRVAA